MRSTAAVMPDILFVAAAGNGGQRRCRRQQRHDRKLPVQLQVHVAGKSWDCVIAVAAITSAGSKSGFSNYGATTVDIGAPGSGHLLDTAGQEQHLDLRLLQRHVDGDTACNRRRCVVCGDASWCIGRHHQDRAPDKRHPDAVTQRTYGERWPTERKRVLTPQFTRVGDCGIEVIRRCRTGDTPQWFTVAGVWRT